MASTSASLHTLKLQRLHGMELIDFEWISDIYCAIQCRFEHEDFKFEATLFKGKVDIQNLLTQIPQDLAERIITRVIRVAETQKYHPLIEWILEGQLVGLGPQDDRNAFHCRYKQITFEFDDSSLECYYNLVNLFVSTPFATGCLDKIDQQVSLGKASDVCYRRVKSVKLIEFRTKDFRGIIGVHSFDEMLNFLDSSSTPIPAPARKIVEITVSEPPKVRKAQIYWQHGDKPGIYEILNFNPKKHVVVHIAEECFAECSTLQCYDKVSTTPVFELANFSKYDNPWTVGLLRHRHLMDPTKHYFFVYDDETIIDLYVDLLDSFDF